MPIFRPGRRFAHRFTRRMRDTARVAGDRTMQTELESLVNTVANPIARKVTRLAIYLRCRVQLICLSDRRLKQKCNPFLNYTFAIKNRNPNCGLLSTF